MAEPRLKWTGTDETDRFHDEERGRIYWASERPLRVPADAVEEYLEQDGWEEPPDEEDTRRFPPEDSESVRDARAREQQEQDREQDREQEHQYEDEDVRAEPATEVKAADSDGDADTQADHAESGAVGGGDEDGDFDADDFVDDDWRAVERRIQSGEYDEHLGAIERAERNREGQPREASVLGAIKDRRSAPLANTDADEDTNTNTSTDADADAGADTGTNTAEVESDEPADDRRE